MAMKKQRTYKQQNIDKKFSYFLYLLGKNMLKMIINNNDAANDDDYDEDDNSGSKKVFTTITIKILTIMLISTIIMSITICMYDINVYVWYQW